MPPEETVTTTTADSTSAPALAASDATTAAATPQFDAEQFKREVMESVAAAIAESKKENAAGGNEAPSIDKISDEQLIRLKYDPAYASHGHVIETELRRRDREAITKQVDEALGKRVSEATVYTMHADMSNTDSALYKRFSEILNKEMPWLKSQPEGSQAAARLAMAELGLQRRSLQGAQTRQETAPDYSNMPSDEFQKLVRSVKMKQRA